MYLSINGETIECVLLRAKASHRERGLHLVSTNRVLTVVISRRQGLLG
jgi:hypothetical protein